MSAVATTTSPARALASPARAPASPTYLPAVRSAATVDVLNNPTRGHLSVMSTRSDKDDAESPRKKGRFTVPDP
jgi:hypothetical protein